MTEKLNLTEMALGRMDSAIMRAENDKKEIMALYNSFYAAWRYEPGVKDTYEARKVLLSAFTKAFIAASWAWQIVNDEGEQRLDLISWRERL